MMPLCFEWKNVQITYQEEILVIEAQMHTGPDKYTNKRYVQIGLHFGNCSIENATITQLIYVKSVLQYFMQTFWKRRNKSGTIEESYRLKKELQVGDNRIEFTTRHKGFRPDKNQIGQISLSIEASDGLNEYIEYFDCQEVMMLETAFTKAIGLLVADIDSSKWEIQRFR
jgi:hypothetical protein